MVEVYRVSAALNLQSNASAVLAGLSRTLGTLDGKIKSLEGNLDRLLAKMAGTGGATQAAERMATAMRAMSRMTDRATASMEAQERVMRRYASAAQGAANATGRMHRAAGGGGGIGGGIGRGGAAGGINTALTVASVTAMAAMGRTMANRGGGGNYGGAPPPLRLAGPAGGPFGGMWGAGLAQMRGGGFGGGFGGGGGWRSGWGAHPRTTGALIGGAVGGALYLGGRFVTEQERLRASGQSPGGVAAASSAAYAATATARGTTATGNLTATSNLFSVTGSLPEAIALMPEFQRAAQVLRAAGGSGAHDAGGVLARVLDLRGAFTPGEDGRPDRARITEEANRFLAAVLTNRGRVDPHQLLNLIQQAGIAGRTASPQAFYGTLGATLSESMGGHRAGTAMAAIQSQLVSGTMTRRTAEQLTRGGILGEGGYTVGRGGHVVIDPAALAGRDILAPADGRTADIMGWVRTILLPRLAERGITQDGEIFDFISRAFGRDTARRGMSELVASRQQEERERTNQAGVYNNIGPITDRLLRDSPANAWSTFTSSLENLVTAAASPLLPPAVAGLNTLSDGIGGLARGMTEVPVNSAIVFRDVPAGLSLMFREMNANQETGFSSLVTNFRAWWGQMTGSAAGPPVPGQYGPPTPGANGLGARRQPIYDPAAFAPPGGNSAASATPIIMQMDGQTIGRIMADRFAQMGNAPPSGASRFDTRRSLPPVEVMA